MTAAPVLRTFLARLRADAGRNVFNPWTERDAAQDGHLNGPAARLARLLHHLDCDPRWLLIGEAAGYQGAKVSGIPFTSERLILAGTIPRVAAPPGARLSLRPRPWSEPSATTVWSTLHALGMAERTILWNAFPWHPHEPGQRLSNRTPTLAERARGAPVLEALLAVFPRARRFAVGRHAEAALAALGIDAQPLRHPSMGGARAFRVGLQRALGRAS